MEDELHEHRIVLSQAQDLGDGRVLAWGRLSVAEDFDVGPFSGLHWIEGRRIVAAHHYRTAPDWIERLGLIS